MLLIFLNDFCCEDDSSAQETFRVFRSCFSHEGSLKLLYKYKRSYTYSCTFIIFTCTTQLVHKIHYIWFLHFKTCTALSFKRIAFAVLSRLLKCDIEFQINVQYIFKFYQMNTSNRIFNSTETISHESYSKICFQN